MTIEPASPPVPADHLGVVIVSFHSSDVIIECLQSLAESDSRKFRIVVVDNASLDHTVQAITEWVHSWNQQHPDRGLFFESVALEEAIRPISGASASLRLVRSPRNSGYAGGCNIGLQVLNITPDVKAFWILNPDCTVPPETIGSYLREIDQHPDFGLMGSRVLYQDPPHLIQSDGGHVNMWLGRCSNLNQGCQPDKVTIPDNTSRNFISGANVVVSRNFYDTIGPMREDYFLYYEEVDWACRRGNLPHHFCQDALVYHHGGTAIGSGTVNRSASSFSNYFNFRNRMRFVARFHPLGLPTAYLYSVALIGRMCLRNRWDEALGAFYGTHQLPPPRSIRERLEKSRASFLLE